MVCANTHPNCVLCTVYCVLCTVYCVLCTVYCVLCTVYCVLCTVSHLKGFCSTKVADFFFISPRPSPEISKSAVSGCFTGPNPHRSQKTHPKITKIPPYGGFQIPHIPPYFCSMSPYFLVVSPYGGRVSGNPHIPPYLVGSPYGGASMPRHTVQASRF